MTHWYDRLRSAQSLGSLTKKQGTLAGLHDDRRQHQGQFFTPAATAEFMFNLVKPELDKLCAKYPGAMSSVLDTSVGSGRLLQFCDPTKHIVGGADVDGELLDIVKQVFEEAGFQCHFQTGSMAALRARNWNVALINPPFSIQLDSPLLQPYRCTTFGRLGKDTSAQSDYYAVAQALDAAQAVVALVPRTVADRVWTDPSFVDWHATDTKSRLLARYDLSGNAFKEEGASVTTSILLFGADQEPLAQRKRYELDRLETELEPVRLGLRMSHQTLAPAWLEDTGPTITLPVTGNDEVKVAHDGRKIRLVFRCGFAQARVMNAVLGHRIQSTKDHRLPNGYKYSGQGALDIETHLLQDDPIASVQELFELISGQGATPKAAPGFWEYVRMRMRRRKRAVEPMAHVVVQKAAGKKTVVARAKKTVLLEPGNWLTPVIPAGEHMEFVRTADDRFETSVQGVPYCLNFEELDERFQCALSDDEAGWVSIHQGLLSRFPDLARQWDARFAKSIVGEFLTWDFQRQDLIELLMCPHGCIVAWAMGLGKTRLAVALILLSGVKHGLVTTEAYLVPEFVDQIEALGLDKSLWKVIRTPEDLRDLRRINLISNQRLRMPLRSKLSDEDLVKEQEKAPEQEKPAKKKRGITYAHRLRRRIGMAISDEGEFLANPGSDRSRAMWRVSAKRRYVLSGTPVPNTPRDMLPILCYVGGDATAEQPWGYRGAYLEPVHRRSVEFAERGVSKFLDEFVTVEWVVNLFSETLREGAKREIPLIKNVQAYRDMIAPFVKRRLTQEPAVAEHVKILPPRVLPFEIPWDEDHLAHYLTVADEFAQWMSRESTRGKNLMVVLLRFQAVVRALNMPQLASKHVCHKYTGITSKQRFLVDRLTKLAEQGRKTLLFVQSPDLAKLLAEQVRKKAGFAPVVVHGGMSAAKRHVALRDRYRRGDTPTAIATFGVTQAGLNLPETQTVILGSRMMTAKAERQAIARALRPETGHVVDVEYPHITGSVDQYLAQMVAFKGSALDECLDYASPMFEEGQYMHMDTILGQFVKDIAERKGVPWHEARSFLKEVA